MLCPDGAVKRHMPELDQASLLAQMQNLEQTAQRLQVPLAEIRDGAEIRRIEPHNAHEINPFPARLGDPARRVDAAAIRIKRTHLVKTTGRLSRRPA